MQNTETGKYLIILANNIAENHPELSSLSESELIQHLQQNPKMFLEAHRRVRVRQEELTYSNRPDALVFRTALGSAVYANANIKNAERHTIEYAARMLQ